MAYDLTAVGRALGEGLSQVGTYSAQAAAQANSVSAAAQSAQGQFNQTSANMANQQNQANMMNQYQFNSAQASLANDFSESMWNRAAEWNEMMWEKQADFNAQQAQIQRDWSERMSNTQYQRAMADMEQAGLNPILAYSQGGAGVPGGSTATVGGAQMSSAQGAMASGGLLGANAASEGNYTGQMEFLSGTLGLISACISGLSTAAGAAGSLGDFGEGLMEEIPEMLTGEKNPVVQLGKKAWDWLDEKTDKAADWIKKNIYDPTKKNKGQITNRQDESQYLRYNAWNNSTWKYTRPKG